MPPMSYMPDVGAHAAFFCSLTSRHAATPPTSSLSSNELVFGSQKNVVGGVKLGTRRERTLDKSHNIALQLCDVESLDLMMGELSGDPAEKTFDKSVWGYVVAIPVEDFEVEDPPCGNDLIQPGSRLPTPLLSVALRGTVAGHVRLVRRSIDRPRPVMTLIKRVAFLEYVVPKDLVNNKFEVNLVDLMVTCGMHHDASLFLTILAMILHPLLIPEAEVKEIRLHMGAARANFEKVNVGVIEGGWNNCGRHGEGFEMIVRSVVWLCSLNGVALRGVT
ncbi:hypothetical protein RAB80_012643 [Fusarium oxysporum f. sp. vasinfectum]|uniref:Uncharacterized protein n=1 Tax=Fusarium oxysporum f. sp. vasinfectum 25433 TaxID=1089449 RepID=X0N0V0_FUSOX|nr:hypothetical protein FOTG_07262 [Fusarium oxysporum f. sp. vasinfectum 25433]KAK2672564.1 hypothetical protein RAB80_012643 [Fusarium oxysporum f. sp. vasinfectum]KAK2928171.1 hypothetical protein FoTM2_011033 [Fusarium oxysporum f. sp. vasinfectum]